MGNHVLMLDDLPIQRVTPALRFLATEAKLSQGKLATKLGMSQSAVARRLNGDTDLGLADLERFAAAMGYEVRVSLVEAAERAA